MNYLLFSFFVLISCILPTNGICQIVNASNYLPTTDARSLGKHGSFPVSLNTGQARVGIPITSLTSNEIDLNIDLSYDGSGIQVDQHPGWVGQSWSINTGGIITRTIQGDADETNHIYSPYYYNNTISYFTVASTPVLQQWYSQDSTDSYEELRNFAIDRDILYGIPIETEPDIFSFNFMGKSGKFYLDKGGDWKVISEDNLKVEFQLDEIANYQDPFILIIPPGITNPKHYPKVIKGFKIIDEMGNKYTFGYHEDAIEYSIPFFQQYGGDQFDFANWDATAWHLTKVEDYHGNEIYSFDYLRSYFTAQLVEGIHSFHESCRLYNGTWTTPDGTARRTAGGTLQSQVYLKKIQCHDGRKIEFKISNAPQLKFPWTNTFDLAESDIVNTICPNGGCGFVPLPHLQTQNAYTFDYVAAFNVNPVEGLMWKKLDTILVFSNQTHLQQVITLNYNNSSTQRLSLMSVDFFEKDIRTNPNATKYSYSLYYDNISTLPPYVSRQIDHFGYYNGTTEYTDFNHNYTGLATNYYPSRNSNYNFAKIGQLIEIRYPLGGKTMFEYELHAYNNVVSEDRSTLLSENGTMGGLRIKRIRNFDDINGNPVTIKTFDYTTNSSANTISSGILGLKPRYVWVDFLYPTDEHEDGGRRQSLWSDNMVLPLVNRFESHIQYKEVSETDQNGQKKTHHFITHQDVLDELPYGNTYLGVSPHFKYSDKSHLRGKTKKLEYFDNSLAKVKEDNYYYSLNTTGEYSIYTDAIFGYSCPYIEQFVDRYYIGNAIKIFHNKQVLDSVKTTYFYGTNQITTIQKNTYSSFLVNGNTYKFGEKTSVMNSDGKLHETINKYTFNHTSNFPTVAPGQQYALGVLTTKHRLLKVLEEKKVNGLLVYGSEVLFNFNSSTLMPSTIKGTHVTWYNNTYQSTNSSIKDFNSYNMTFLLPFMVQDRGWQNKNIGLSTTGKVNFINYVDQTSMLSYYPNDMLNIHTAIDGRETKYEYDKHNRVKTLTELDKNVVNNYTYYFTTVPNTRSYFKTRTTYPPATDSALDSIVYIHYVDGLGRPIQDIHKYGAPDGADVITKTEYDVVGRSTKTYEPISANANHGAYYTGSFGGGYTEQLYHPDPLDRPSQTTPPAWQSTQTTYGTNASALTNPEGTVYAANSLHLTTTTDPDSKHTDVYTDKLGQVVLVRRRQAANTADTWTIYDDKQREIKVYPPGSSTATPDLIHEKRYDGDDNVIYLKKPDAAAEEYRYSSRNLPIANRNGVLAAQGRWLVTHYDVYGRPTKRGYYTGSDPGTTENPTIATLLEEYFYDGYNGSTTNTAPIYKGKLKKKRIKALEDNGTNGAWTETEYTYDTYGRIGTETIANHLGSTETKTYTYDFGDNMTSETCVLTGANGVTHVNKHSYDAQGRKIVDKVSINGGTEVTTAQTNYNHKSQMVERNLGRFATTGTHQYLQSLDYTYHPQGWLTSINTLFNGYLPNYDPCDTGTNSGTTTTETTSANTDDYDLFALELGYNTALGGSGITASQNGNITSVIWRHPGQYNQSYSCKYDFLNRLTEARHGEIVAGAHTLKHYYTEKLGYDQRSNILQLTRRGMVQRPHIADACYQPATIDSLTYIYPVGSNKLVQVVDNAPCPDVVTLPAVIDRDITYAALTDIHINKTKVRCGVNMDLFAQMIQVHDSLYLAKESCTAPVINAYPGPCPQVKHTEGFSQQSATGQYTYDNSGNLGYDPNKKVTYYYNYLNLQHKIIGAEGDTLFNLYSADGTLLQRKYKVGTTIKYKKDYLDNKELSNDVIESIYHNDGRVVKDDSVFKYEYWIKDHLGNVRVTFSDDNGNGLLVGDEIRSRNDYYTFGMEMNSRWKLAETYHLLNQKKYNGKEWVNDMNLGQLLYGKRPYNPILCRFESTDPISHMFPSLSGYNYASNNPIRNIDLHGLQGVDAVAGALVGDDNKGYIKTASKTLREDSPRLAGLQDAAFAILDFIGFNHFDNVYFGDQPTTTAEKVAAVVPLLFNTKGTVDEGAKSVKYGTSKTKGVEPYEIGEYSTLQKKSNVGDNLDLHHVPQKQQAKQVINNYDQKTAPSVALPSKQHKSIPTRKGEYNGSARDLLAKDAKDLRRAGVNNNTVMDLINYNKIKYPTSYVKPK